MSKYRCMVCERHHMEREVKFGGTELYFCESCIRRLKPLIDLGIKTLDTTNYGYVHISREKQEKYVSEYKENK